MIRSPQLKKTTLPVLRALASLVWLIASPNFSHAAFITSSGKPAPLDADELLSPFVPSDTLEGQLSGAAWELSPYIAAPETGIEESEEGAVSDVDSTDSEPSPADAEPIFNVPAIFNESVENYIHYFQNVVPDRFIVWLERSGRFLPMMQEEFRRQGLPEDLIYLSLIESGFNPKAHSRAHAVGPWQFMAGTGRLYNLKIDRWVDERRDPVKSTHAAARHLKDLYERFESWPLAMASYNAGIRKIERGLKKARTDNYWDLRRTSHIRRETQGYVPKFMAALLIAKNPHRYGFYPEYHEPFSYDTVEVPAMASLSVIAEAAGISISELRDLNPEILTEITPPSESSYLLRLPKGTVSEFEVQYADVPESRKIFRTRYVVKRNDTLSGIAKRYGTTAGMLAQMNNRRPRSVLNIGDVLFIPKVDPIRSPRKSRESETIPVADASAAGSHKIVYRVQAGDTLWDIARYFNISLARLKQHNGLDAKSRIYPGDVLILGFK